MGFNDLTFLRSQLSMMTSIFSKKFKSMLLFGLLATSLSEQLPAIDALDLAVGSGIACGCGLLFSAYKLNGKSRLAKKLFKKSKLIENKVNFAVKAERYSNWSKFSAILAGLAVGIPILLRIASPRRPLKIKISTQTDIDGEIEKLNEQIKKLSQDLEKQKIEQIINDPSLLPSPPSDLPLSQIKTTLAP